MLISEIKGCGICKYLRDNVQNSHHNMHKISSNQLFTNHFSKSVTFTKFLPKMRESKFPPMQKFFVKLIYSIIL